MSKLRAATAVLVLLFSTFTISVHAESKSTFSGLYIGMASKDLAAIQEKNKKFSLKYFLAVEGLRSPSTKKIESLRWDEYSDNVEIHTSEKTKDSYLGYLKIELTSKPDLNNLKSNSGFWVNSDDRKNGLPYEMASGWYRIPFVFLNMPSPPSFTVTEMILDPDFFHAQGMKIDEFAQAFANHYSLIDDTLYPGGKKGLECNICYTGLLNSGEGVLISSHSGRDEYDWEVKIFKPNDSFAKRFESVEPKF